MAKKKVVANVPQLRLRVFAGPNGSGKSTIIKGIRTTKINGKLIDFGHYINADEIASSIQKGNFSFSSFDITVNKASVLAFAVTSGLIEQTAIAALKSGFTIQKNIFRLKNVTIAEQIAQIIARYLREEMLIGRKRFSFETVFSHDSNVDIMRRAKEAGYKVYLYFVSTASYFINQYRVKLRVKEGGHDVPPLKIKSRYYRSLDLLYAATQQSYQAFVFDNSIEGSPYQLVYHQRLIGNNILVIDDTKRDEWPEWFKQYYILKESKPE